MGPLAVLITVGAVLTVAGVEKTAHELKKVERSVVRKLRGKPKEYQPIQPWKRAQMKP